jgi:hypothetical protein
MKALWSVKSPYSLGSISSFSDKSNLKKKKTIYHLTREFYLLTSNLRSQEIYRRTRVGWAGA